MIPRNVKIPRKLTVPAKLKIPAKLQISRNICTLSWHIKFPTEVSKWPLSIPVEAEKELNKPDSVWCGHKGRMEKNCWTGVSCCVFLVPKANPAQSSVNKGRGEADYARQRSMVGARIKQNKQTSKRGRLCKALWCSRGSRFVKTWPFKALALLWASKIPRLFFCWQWCPDYGKFLRTAIKKGEYPVSFSWLIV